MKNEKFSCPENCSLCCQPNMIVRSVFDEHIKDLQETPSVILDAGKGLIIPLTDSMICCFLDRDSNECLIGKDMPPWCRDRGTSKSLPCLYIDENGEGRSRQGKRKIHRLLEKQKKELLNIVKEQKRTHKAILVENIKELEK